MGDGRVDALRIRKGGGRWALDKQRLRSWNPEPLFMDPLTGNFVKAITRTNSRQRRGLRLTS